MRRVLFMIGDDFDSNEEDRVMVLRIHVSEEGLLHVDRLYESPCALGPERFYRYYSSTTKKFTSVFDVTEEEMEKLELRREYF